MDFNIQLKFIYSVNTNVPDSPEHINEDQANQLFNESIDGGEAEPLTDLVDKWHFIHLK